MKTHSKHRIIIGGTFDPFHWGHWAIVSNLLKYGYPQIHVVVAGDPYHKSERQITPAAIRLEMVQSFFNDPLFGEGVTVEDIEVKRTGPSYTYDTVVELKEKYPKDNFSFAFGTDIVANLHKWHKATELVQLVTPLIVQRGGDTYNLHSLRPIMSEDQIKTIRDYRVIRAEEIELSSTDIRKMVKNGEDISEFVPRQVIDIIERENLYQ